MIRFLGSLFAVLILLALGGAGGLLFVFWKFGSDLPDYQQLANYQPKVVTRIHAADGRLMAEYAKEKRLFVPVDAMPKQLINAFLSAEDQNFYQHPGIDFTGVMRAVLINLRNLGSDRRMVGASTITQQVAKNFLLTNEVSFDRKIKEAILSFRIEHAFTKKQILELYLNEIYLGYGSYGVAAAALNYFDKSLDELTIHEMAYLAALPKAPNNYHPVRKTKAAVARRNWVVDRMVEDKHLTEGDGEAAKRAVLRVANRAQTEFVNATWFTEEVRRQLLEQYGENGLYEGGLSVRTTMSPHLQDLAQKVLRDGLMAYDRRHGWRGPLGRVPPEQNWASTLSAFERPPALLDTWDVAVVLEVGKKSVQIGLSGGVTGRIPFKGLAWARPWKEKQRVGPKVRRAGDVLAVGDIVAVEAMTTESSEGGGAVSGDYHLRQVPDVNGSVVALDPHTGRVKALVGGWNAEASEFNRAVQAMRQPGSAFKPFVYAAALDSGFTPSSLVLDAPFVIDQGAGLGKWKPANYTKKFYGPSTLRLGIEKSRNLMTVRLAQYIGMEAVADAARRFGVVDDMPRILSMSLGAGETTLLRITTGYAMMVNGGKWIAPSLVDRIQDRRGKTVFRHDKRDCPQCLPTAWASQDMPQLPDDRPKVIDPRVAYQVVSMLQGVVERGTGVRIKKVGKPLAGKTGTTNKSFDAWFIGFSPDLAVGVYVGFDSPKTLGRREQGASVAVPIFRDFMAGALETTPSIPFRIPPGVRLVRVDPRSGVPAPPGARKYILEAFLPGTEPTNKRQVLDGSQGGSTTASGDTPQSGTGGLY